MKTHYAGLVASTIKALINGERLAIDATGIRADQFQSNGAYGVKQVRVRMPDDGTIYRVIIAPADAPLTVAGLPIDEHFNERIAGERA